MDDFQTELSKSPLPFLHQLQELKHLPRTGWLRFTKTCEAVASHSWRLAFLALFAPPHLNLKECVLMGLVHDAGELYAGDIPPHAKVSKDEKHSLERTGFLWIESLLNPVNPDLATQLTKIWLDYDEERTEEGKWMKQADKLECLIQAHEYEEQTFGEEKGLEEFQGLLTRLQHPTLKTWGELLSRERSLHLEKRNRRLSVIFIVGNENHARELCTRQAEDDRFHYLSLRDALVQQSETDSFTHKEFLKYCLAESFDVPKGLVVQVLEESIRKTTKTEKTWVLVQGFPQNFRELQEFKRKVQKTNLYIHLTTSNNSVGRIRSDDGLFESNFETQLKLEEYYEEVLIDQCTTESFARFEAVVKSMVERAESNEH